MRIRVATRVLGAFAVVIAMGTGIGTIAYVGSGSINGRVEALVDRQVPALVKATQLSVHAERLAALTDAWESASGTPAGDVILLSAQQESKLGTALIAALAPDISEDIRARIDSSRRRLEDMLDGASEDTSLDPYAQAYLVEARQLNDLISNRIVAERAAIELSATAVQQQILSLGGAALIVIFAVLVYLNRNVIRRLVRLQTSMAAFVEGREHEIPTEGSDEIASMGRALDYLVTTLRRREERLEEQLNFQRTLLDTIPNPIFYKDNNGRFLGANAAFESVVGLTPDEVIGKTPFDIDRPDLAERYDPQERLMAAGKRRYSYETQKVFADGKSHHVMFEKASFINDEGKSTGVAGVIVDITRLKEAERELQAAKEMAEAANLAKSSFLAAMSHEIRTPMNGVTGMIELLEQTGMERDQRQMLRTVRESADALLRIIDDILDFSKIEAGRLDLESLPVSLQSTVNGVAETLLPNIQKRGRNVGLLAYVDPDLPDWVFSDPVRLRQILLNLAGNAVKFTEAGKVVIAAEKVASVDQSTVRVRFRVSDTGIGISAENQRKLFEAFTQAEGSITRRFGGTGLGLSISRRLVDLMGGEIGIESELGQGATFSFEISMEMATPPEGGDDDAGAYDLRGLHVLVCLADPEEQEFVDKYLAGAGLRFTIAETVGRMIDGCGLADVLIIDTWPGSGGSGAELAASVADEMTGRKLPGIVQIITGSEKSADVAVSLKRPYRASALLEAIAVAAGLIDRVRQDKRPDRNDSIQVNTPPSRDDARAAGRLVLAVEDHPVNRQVLQRQLHTLGYAVEMAENGIQALEMWRDGDYSLILTDCHMPDMDGFELTAAIRAGERAGEGHIPIIAATANALQGEAENCLRAGMDGYLSKPINLDSLAAELAKWLPQGNVETAPAVEDATVAASGNNGNGHIDLNVLRAICHGDEDSVFELLGDFVDINDLVVNELMSSVETHDANEVGGIAHKLKGSAGTAGAKPLAEIAKALEHSGAHGDWEAIVKLAPALYDEFQMLKGEIAKLRS